MPLFSADERTNRRRARPPNFHFYSLLPHFAYGRATTRKRRALPPTLVSNEPLTIPYSTDFHFLLFSNGLDLLLRPKHRRLRSTDGPRTTPSNACTVERRFYPSVLFGDFRCPPDLGPFHRIPMRPNPRTLVVGRVVLIRI